MSENYRDIGRKIVEDAFRHARAELRKRHVFQPDECYGDLCICAEPKPIEPPKQEPTPRAGQTRCANTKLTICSCFYRGSSEVYRASTSSWSADTRKRQRRVWLSAPVIHYNGPSYAIIDRRKQQGDRRAKA